MLYGKTLKFENEESMAFELRIPMTFGQKGAKLLKSSGKTPKFGKRW
jgi:hypothetical protein